MKKAITIAIATNVVMLSTNWACASGALSSNGILKSQDVANTLNSSSTQNFGNLIQESEITKKLSNNVELTISPNLGIQYGIIWNSELFSNADMLKIKYGFTSKTALFENSVFPYNLAPNSKTRWGDFNRLTNIGVKRESTQSNFTYGGYLSLFANFSRPTSGGDVMTAGEAYVYLKSKDLGFVAEVGSVKGVQNQLLISANNIAKGSIGLDGDVPFYIAYPAIAPFNQVYDNGSIYNPSNTSSTIFGNPNGVYLFTVYPYSSGPMLPGPANIAPKANKISFIKDFDDKMNAKLCLSFTPNTNVKAHCIT